MEEKQLSMAELKNKSLAFDRAEVRNLFAEHDGITSLCRTHVQVWNTDKKRQACVAPKSYQVIQHKDATQAVIEVLASFNIKSTADVKVSKHRIHIDFDFPKALLELQEVDELFSVGIRLVNDYSQCSGLLIAPRVKRLACLNGMVVTDIVSPERVRYKKQLNITLQATIDRMINGIITGDEKLQGVVSACMVDSVEWTAVQLLVEELFKKKKHVWGVLNRLPDRDASGKINRWQLYNAVTEYATHGRRIKPDVEAWLQNKANLIFGNSFAKLSEIKPADKRAGSEQVAAGANADE